jgi:N utilization substance protein A
VSTFGLGAAIAERLVAVGINSPAAFEGVDVDALVESGFTAEESSSIMERVSSV